MVIAKIRRVADTEYTLLKHAFIFINTCPESMQITDSKNLGIINVGRAYILLCYDGSGKPPARYNIDAAPFEEEIRLPDWTTPNNAPCIPQRRIPQSQAVMRNEPNSKDTPKTQALRAAT